MFTNAVAIPGNYNREKLDLIKQTVAKGATDLELELFMHACQRTGLDPLMKQIYAIKRWSSVDRREVLSFQTGIDGYRLIADRTGLYAGSDEPFYVFDEEDHPRSARVTVYKLVNGEKCAFSASARWTEYVQLTKEGQPTSMWKKMPYLMLAKCAEALALRKAFPAELSGVYTHEEMMQADTEPRKPVRLPSEILAESERSQEDGASGHEQPVHSQQPSDAPATPNLTAKIMADSPPPLPDDPAEHYRAKLRTCARDAQTITHTYNAIPEEVRQDVHEEFQKQLRSLKSSKGK